MHSHKIKKGQLKDILRQYKKEHSFSYSKMSYEELWAMVHKLGLHKHIPVYEELNIRNLELKNMNSQLTKIQKKHEYDKKRFDQIDHNYKNIVSSFNDDIKQASKDEMKKTTVLEMIKNEYLNFHKSYKKMKPDEFNKIILDSYNKTFKDYCQTPFIYSQNGVYYEPIEIMQPRYDLKQMKFFMNLMNKMIIKIKSIRSFNSDFPKVRTIDKYYRFYHPHLLHSNDKDEEYNKENQKILKGGDLIHYNYYRFFFSFRYFPKSSFLYHKLMDKDIVTIEEVSKEVMPFFSKKFNEDAKKVLQEINKAHEIKNKKYNIIWKQLNIED